MRDFVEWLKHGIAAARRSGGVSLLLAGLAAAVYLSPPAVARALEYDRGLISAGQLHRVITCHFAHWNHDHFVWDAMLFLILAIDRERAGRRQMLGALFLAAVAIPCALLMFQPEMLLYRGLSGLDSALFVLLCLDVARERAREGEMRWVMMCAVLLAAFLVKSAIEFTTGAAIFVDSRRAGFVAVPLAHLIGGLAGAAVALMPAATQATVPGSNRLGHSPRAGVVRER